MKDPAEITYNVQTQTPKMLHVSFSFTAMRVHMTINTPMHSHTHTHTHLHTASPTCSFPWFLLPFVWLFQWGTKLIKIMEGNVLILEGSCFNPFTWNRRALVTLASSPYLDWGQERKTGFQNTKSADTLSLTCGTVTQMRDCCTQGLPAAQCIFSKGWWSYKYAQAQQRFR